MQIGRIGFRAERHGQSEQRQPGKQPGDRKQQRYDRETGNGTDASRQRAWMQKVAKALRDTYATAAR